MRGGGPKVRAESLKGAAANLGQSSVPTFIEWSVKEARQSEFLSETMRCLVPQDTGIVESGVGKWNKRDNIENPKAGVNTNMLGEIKVGDNSSAKLNDAFKQCVVCANQSEDAPMMDGVSVHVNAAGCLPCELINERAILTF